MFKVVGLLIYYCEEGRRDSLCVSAQISVRGGNIKVRHYGNRFVSAEAFAEWSENVKKAATYE